MILVVSLGMVLWLKDEADGAVPPGTEMLPDSLPVGIDTVPVGVVVGEA